MNKEFLSKYNIIESPNMVFLGVICFYLLILMFFLYMFMLHKFNLIITIILVFASTMLYLDRFLILYKLSHKDNIEVLDESIIVNGLEVPFDEIIDFRIEKKKPMVIFIFLKFLILFQESRVHLQLSNSIKSFNVYGLRKSELLEDYFNQVLR